MSPKPTSHRRARRTRRNVLLAVLAVLALTLSSAAAAWAYTRSSGAGSGAATLGTLHPPTGLTAPSLSTGTVHLSWTAATGNPAPTGYYLTRIADSDNSRVAACATSPTATISASSCDDLAVPIGAYHYTATSVYRSWTATSGLSGPVSVAAPVLTTLSISPASATSVAGIARSYTATGQDQTGASMGDLTPSTTFTIGPDGSCSTNRCQAVISDSASTQHTVTGTNAGHSGTARLTITPAAAGSLTVTGYPTPTVAGAPHPFTVTAKDAFGNIATGYTGTVHLTSSDPSAVLPANYTFTSADLGVHTGLTATMATVGTQSLTATDILTTSITGAQTGIGVTPGAAARFTLTAASSTPAAGAGDNLTITARDAYGNLATGYTGDKNLSFAGAAASPNGNAPSVTNKAGTATPFGTATTITFTGGVASATGANNGSATLYTAGAALLTVADPASVPAIPASAGLSLTVSAGPASRLAWNNPVVSSGTLSSPCLFACGDILGNGGTYTAKVAVTDLYGNVVTGLGTGHTVMVTTTGGGAFTAPASGASVTLTISATGAAVSTVSLAFKAQNGAWSTDSLTANTAAGTVYTFAAASFSKQ